MTERLELTPNLAPEVTWQELLNGLQLEPLERRMRSVNPKNLQLLNQRPDIAEAINTASPGYEVNALGYSSLDIDMPTWIMCMENGVNLKDIMALQTRKTFISQGFHVLNTTEVNAQVNQEARTRTSKYQGSIPLWLRDQIPADLQAPNLDHCITQPTSLEGHERINAAIAFQAYRKNLNLDDLQEYMIPGEIKASYSALRRGIVFLVSKDTISELTQGDKPVISTGEIEPLFEHAAHLLRELALAEIVSDHNNQGSGKRHRKDEISRHDIYPPGEELLPDARFLPYLGLELAIMIASTHEWLPYGTYWEPKSMNTMAASYTELVKRVLANQDVNHELAVQALDWGAYTAELATTMIPQTLVWDKRTEGSWSEGAPSVQHIKTIIQQIRESGGRAPTHIGIQVRRRHPSLEPGSA